MIEAVHRYDGYVVQSTGDGIFALFGAPIAHEDHPQRALCCGATDAAGDAPLLGEAARGGQRAHSNLRIGANTGEVVVRSIRTGEGACRVHADRAYHEPRVADAGAGADRLDCGDRDHPTAVRGILHVSSALGPTRVKGVSEPVNVHEVTGFGPLRTRLQRAAGRGLTKFVGREREMAEMRRALELAKTGARTDRRRDGRGGARQVAAVLRVQGDLAEWMSGAGDLLGLARQGVGLPAHH